MSKPNQMLFGRATFATLVFGSLTFGAVQVFARDTTSVCGSGPVCYSRPYDSTCASYCLAEFPENGGRHLCSPEPGTNTYCCACAA